MKMHKWKLFRKSVPIIMSAAMAVPSVPAITFAAEADAFAEEVVFTDTEISLAEEVSEEIQTEPSEQDELAVQEIPEVEEIPEVQEASEIQEVPEVQELCEIQENSGAAEEFPAAEDDIFKAEGDIFGDALAEEAEEASADGYVYGKVNLTYADFYYGELNTVPENASMDLEAVDPVSAAGYRESGMYDSVTSATTSKSKRFAATYFEDAEGGVEIKGIINVNIAVPKTLYDAAQTAIKEGAKCNNKLLEFVQAMTVTDSVPAEYKVLNGNGTLGAMKSEVLEDASAAASITTSTAWGNYQISITSDYIPENSEMLGAVIETANGKKYGLEHLENLWLRPAEMAFAVLPDFVEPHGNHIDYKRFEDLQGQTITKITYMIKDKADLVVNTNLLCKRLLGEGFQVTGSDGVYADGAAAAMTIQAPADSSYQMTSVSFGGKVLTAGTDYKYENNTLTVYKTENTGVGQYTLTYVDAVYEDMSTAIILASSYEEGSIKLENNKLVLPEGLDMAAYLNSISGVSINGKSLPGRNLGSVVFNEDGSVNFAAEINNHGTKTVVFPDGEGVEYEISISSIGYPSVTAKVTSPKPELLVSPEKATIYTQEKTTLKVTQKDISGELTFASSDSSIASVDAKGVVTGKKAGTAVIIVTCGEYKAECTVAVKAVVFKLNKTAATIYTKGTTRVALKVTKTGVSGTVKYTSSNPKVAVVGPKGVVTAKKAGTTTITATCGSYKATCKITVKAPALKLNKTKATIYTAGTKRVALKATQVGISGTVKYSSSNPKVAVVGPKGVVTAKKAGTATITATCGSYKATCKVTVKKPSLTLTKSTGSVKVGKTVAIKAKVLPSTAKITYKSANPKTASVDAKGVVKGLKKGKATIKVTCAGVKKTFIVTVK